MAEWKLINKPLYWKDGNHTLKRHYVLIDEKHKCHGCKKELKDDEQAYMLHDTITRLKKRLKGDQLPPTKHLCIYGHQLACFMCFVRTPGHLTFHKVRLKKLINNNKSKTGQ